MNFLIKSIALLTLCAAVQAQDVPEILPADPALLPPDPEQPAGHKQAMSFNHNTMAAKVGQVIDGSNWDDQSIADAYTLYTGKRVLLSSATRALEIRFYQRGPLTNREAANLLVKVLSMEGYVFVDSGANVVKLLSKAAGGAASGPSELEGVIDSELEIPAGDEYISYFMKLDYIKPEDATRAFTQSLNGLDQGSKIAPLAHASGLMITGKSSFVRKLINQKKYIDVPAGSVDNKWIPVYNADAEEVAAKLNEIVNASQETNTSARVTTNAPRGNTPQIPGQNAAGGNNAANNVAAGETIPVLIVANARLNKIFVRGRNVDVLFVEGLISEFDMPTSQVSELDRQLNFMIAGDFFDVAVQALEALNSASRDPGAAGAGATGRNQNAGQQNNNQNRGGDNGADGVSRFDVNSAPQAASVGKSFIVADNVANRIFVSGPPESIRVVSDLIDKLDTRPQQVYISSIIGKVTLGENNETGFNLGFLTNDLAGGFNNNGLVDPGSITDASSTDGANLSNLATLLSGGGLNVYGAYRNLTATLVALQAKSDFNVIATPSVYASNNTVGVLSSGQRIAVPTNTITTDTGSQNTNIEFRDVLLQLEVVPLINSDDEVTLNISILNEDVQGFQLIDGEQIPTIVTESIETTVRVANGAAVALGGLITEDETSSRSGVPVLSSIPGIGRLFRRESKSVTRQELLVFIQPTIVNDLASHKALQESVKRKFDVAAAMDEAALGGVLPTREEAEGARVDRSEQNAPTRQLDFGPDPSKTKRVKRSWRSSQFR